MIGISPDGAESHRSFAAHHRLPFTLLSDADNEVRRLYGVRSLLGLTTGRVTFVIDKEGLVRHVFNSQLQPRKHVDEALRVLKSVDSLPDGRGLTPTVN